MLKAIGFKHVTAAGAQDFVDMLSSEGSIGLMWDLTSQYCVDVLMQTENFNPLEYCKKLNGDVDAAMVELHEELCDARFSLTYAFSQSLSAVECPASGRSFRDIVWLLRAPCVFNDLDDLAKFVAANIEEHGEIFVRLVADISADDSTDGQEPQSLEFRLSGAGDFQVLEDVSKALTNWGYSITYVIE